MHGARRRRAQLTLPENRHRRRLGGVPMAQAPLPTAGRNGEPRAGHRSPGGRFISLPGGLVRYDVRSANAGRLEHRVGIWKLTWNDGAVTHLEPVEETVHQPGVRPWFRDVTGASFAAVDSFQAQLAKGIPILALAPRLRPAASTSTVRTASLLPTSTATVSTKSTFASPGGLPNRLYKNDGNGRFRDVSHDFGLDILDNTTSALFADLRELRPSGLSAGSPFSTYSLPQRRQR